ncbi:aldose 1-epimerase [Candidatus Poribacteria bacterium]|nr:aldose 1-epimerase [Candidatus Poribacteria bacterium]
MPLTYSIHDATHGGTRVLELRDEARKQRARILPGIGATCMDYTVTHHGQIAHLLDPPPDIATIVHRPTSYGTPILFPFPNRIRHGIFMYDGEMYEFEDKHSAGHHIHGLVYTRAWKVAEHKATPHGASCALTFDSREFADIGRQYPFPFRLRVEYSLHDNALAMTFSATNAGERTLPMGVGFHPYFRCPISERTSPENCVVTVPAAAYWELDQHLLPTGRIVPVSGRTDLRKGKSFEGMRWDDVFTGIEKDERDGKSRCVIEDRALGLKTVVESDGVFREIVVYTPPNRRAICFEPYTCPTDAPNLAIRGLDVGLIELEPGKSFVGTMRVTSKPV